MASLLVLLLAACGAPSVQELPPEEQRALRAGQQELAAIITGITKANYGSGTTTASFIPDCERGIALAQQLKARFGAYRDEGQETDLNQWFDRKIANLEGKIAEARGERK